MARASGWVESSSSAWATARTSDSEAPLYPTTSTTCGWPVVSVPVLSNATAVTLLAMSKNAPPFTSTPIRAARVMAETNETGVEMTSAQGHATTSSDSAR